MRVMIIPAAGTGSRLRAPVPKALVPINGKPMIEHLLDLYSPFIQRFIVVLSPDAVGIVRERLAGRADVSYAVQETPTGMLDAIFVPYHEIRAMRPRHVWITWCDQVAVSPLTATHLAELCDRDPTAALIFPTVARSSPYTHLVRDGSGRILKVLLEREGDEMPIAGESEMGLFSLSGAAYIDSLLNFAIRAEAGASTGELNFLPFIPWVAARAAVRTFICPEETEAVGVNTAEDLQLVEAYLKVRP